MKLALTAGGTGGHIFPALSVLDAMQARYGAELDVRFFGPEDRGERLVVESRGIHFEGVPSAAVRGRSPLQLARAGARLLGGTVIATWKLARYRPAVVFSTGGYASFPCSVAARLLRRPLVVYLPDVTPGWAVRVEQRLATRIATTAVAALDHLPRGKTAVTGYPVREAYFTTTWETAREQLGIAPDERVLLIAGASQGSQTINATVFAGLPTLLKHATVVHITGQRDIELAQAQRERLTEDVRDRYHPYPFREDMPALMRAADLGVMRAGASVIGELPAAALPAILVPGTFAGGHQRANAGWLAEQGAAEMVEEKHLDALAARAVALLGNPATLAAMREAAGGLARPNAANAIADLVVEVARQ